MAAAALVLSMLDDKPVLILAPATLIWQWQDELEDKLGVPAAVWSTQKKCWLDGERRPLTQKGDATLVAKCPWRVGIVSTGLIVNGDDEGERGALAKKTFGVVILDEAHKARSSRGQSGREAARPNNLLEFLRDRRPKRSERHSWHRDADPDGGGGVVGPALRPRSGRAAGAGDAVRRRRMDARGVDPVPDPRAALASQRHEPLGPVSQPAAARERAQRIS